MAAIVEAVGQKRFLRAPRRAYGYYTLETAPQDTPDGPWAFWEWQNGKHRLYSFLPDADEHSFVGMIVEDARPSTNGQ